MLSCGKDGPKRALPNPIFSSFPRTSRLWQRSLRHSTFRHEAAWFESEIFKCRSETGLQFISRRGITITALNTHKDETEIGFEDGVSALTVLEASRNQHGEKVTAVRIAPNLACYNSVAWNIYCWVDSGKVNTRVYSMFKGKVKKKKARWLCIILMENKEVWLTVT